MIRIGELAHQSQVSRDTLRFYEKHGLITPSARTDAGYRLYAESDIKRIGFIVSAKKVGFTLNEIQQLLQLEVTKDIKSCQDVKEFVDHKIQLVNQQLIETRRIKKSLETLSEACCGGDEPATQCTILDTLNR
ncbi:Zn(2+)-responsive transcriptional regulator [Porticoccaceae bacterium]|jgi:MerR family Zn(II)-responsive transcriptional regulator of zntA|nr:Zn(2+)-responsive transcriptional regulator [Porticoccaceae bacterium]MDA8652449.1 Zn(2+)-responsive transcriptional regulator [Porticoccaceae bacterium]MDA8681313.1 Zn(2+)-responsive transcriptional regulator [Porticoccaceae bacterium]MDB2665034.1 Zn(2+)-responsive transcriptional regulator [Porticoccaceae bacterium]